MFTRTFIGSFQDVPQAISEWLRLSPGVQEGTSEKLANKEAKIILKMREGASYGEIIVSADGKHVRFKIEWS